MGCPDFVCMGFQKCGTTTLYEIMRQHPGVVLCRDVKEPMYYRLPFIHYLGFGKKYYDFRYFAHVKPGDPRMKGEINAGLTFAGCAARLKRDMDPDVKMIFMMRDPAERSYSAYKYFLARGFLPFETVEDDQKNGHAAAFDRYVRSVLEDPSQRKEIMHRRLRYLVLSQSNYAACVQEYLDRFPKENMKFVLFEEFIKDQHAGCRELFAFLGLPDSDAIDYTVRANEGKERPATAKAARHFQTVKGWNYVWYEFANMVNWGPKLYGRFRGYYEKAREAALVPDTDRSRMLPETRAYLAAYFEPEVRRLERIIGRDLKHIWNI